MSPTRTRKKTTTYPVAHIVTPARQLAEAKKGEDVTALCGAKVISDPDPGAGICSACVIAQFEADDRSFDTRAQERFDAGRETGIEAGKREAKVEHDEAARADRARERELGRTIVQSVRRLFDDL